MHGGVQAFRIDAPRCLSASLIPGSGGPLGGPLRGGDRGGPDPGYIVMDVVMIPDWLVYGYWRLGLTGYAGKLRVGKRPRFKSSKSG